MPFDYAQDIRLYDFYIRLLVEDRERSFTKWNEVEWCHGAELNHRHKDFQSSALPLSYRGLKLIKLYFLKST